MMTLKSTTKALLFGILLTFVVNCILVTTSFTVGSFKLFSHEICFVKAFLQTFGFTLSLMIKTLWGSGTQDVSDDDVTSLKLSSKMKSAIWVIVFSLATGTMTLTAYIGVKLVPVPDFVVLGHTASFFTLILSAIFLKQTLTALRVTLCALVICGVVLVVQPTFIFGHEKSDPVDMSYDMGLGTLVGLTCAFSAGLINVSANKCLGISRLHLMVMGGVGTYVITLIGFYTLPLSSEGRLQHLPLLYRILLTVGVAIGSIIGGHLLVIANQNAPPTIVALIRSTEIILALLIDKFLFEHREVSAIHTLGAVLVLVGVALMTITNHLQKLIDRFANKKLFK